MPTADSFTALGRGNGFPFCASKIDVSEYDNWITLGGTEKGNNPTDEEKSTSLENAMKLWWNYYSATGSVSASSSNPLDGSGSVTHTDKEVIIKAIGEEDALEPVNRSCKGTDPFPFRNDSLVTQFSDEDSVVNDFAFVFITAGSSQFIRRMYDGITSDESNFVGYGVNGLYLSRSTALTAGGSSDADVEISVGSFLDGTNFTGPDPNVNLTFLDIKVFQTNLNGIPFRSKTYCEAGSPGVGSGSSHSLSALELSGTAEASFTSSYDGSVYSSAASASISSIDFYTYS